MHSVGFKALHYRAGAGVRIAMVIGESGVIGHTSKTTMGCQISET